MRADPEKAKQQYNAMTNKRDNKSKMAMIILSGEYEHPLDAPWAELKDKFSHENDEFLEALKKKKKKRGNE